MSKMITIKCISITIPADEETGLQKLILSLDGGRINSWGASHQHRGPIKEKEKLPTPYQDYIYAKLVKSGNGMTKDQICVDVFQNSGLSGVKLRSGDLPLNQLVGKGKVIKEGDLYKAVIE